jgi:sugar/nucleoside kinase (ribokinase family)
MSADTVSQIIAIGGANIDIKAKANGELIAGTSNPGTVSFAPGGVARNVAHNLARLEIPVALISAMGTDAFSDSLIAETEAAGVDCSMVQRIRGEASSYVAILDGKGEMAMAVNAMAAMDALTPETLAIHNNRLAAARFIFADCNLPRESLSWLIRFAAKLIIDPVSIAKAAKVHALSGHGIFALTCNRGQAAYLAGLVVNGIDDAIEASRVLHAQGFERVVLTLGPDGAVASQKGGNVAHVKPCTSGACDVTGAGDAVTAGLIFGLAEGRDLIAATGLGQAAASLAIAAMDSVAPGLTRARLLSLGASHMDQP